MVGVVYFISCMSLEYVWVLNITRVHLYECAGPDCRICVSRIFQNLIVLVWVLTWVTVGIDCWHVDGGLWSILRVSFDSSHFSGMFPAIMTHILLQCLPPKCLVVVMVTVMPYLGSDISNWNWWSIPPKNRLKLKELELKFRTNKLNLLINLPFNFFIQKYFFHDSTTWNINYSQ